MRQNEGKIKIFPLTLSLIRSSLFALACFFAIRTENCELCVLSYPSPAFNLNIFHSILFFRPLPFFSCAFIFPLFIVTTQHFPSAWFRSEFLYVIRHREFELMLWKLRRHVLIAIQFRLIVFKTDFLVVWLFKITCLTNNESIEYQIRWEYCWPSLRVNFINQTSAAL